MQSAICISFICKKKLNDFNFGATAMVPLHADFTFARKESFGVRS